MHVSQIELAEELRLFFVTIYFRTDGAERHRNAYIEVRVGNTDAASDVRANDVAGSIGESAMDHLVTDVRTKTQCSILTANKERTIWFQIGFSPAAIGRYVVFLKTQRSLSPTDPMPFTMTFLEIDIGFDDVQII